MSMEAFVNRAPIDRTAAIVTSRGFQYVPDKKTNKNHWDKCPELREFSKKHPDQINLVGVRFGRFVVVGLYVKRSRRGDVWVCRCACGHFETRTARVVKKGKDADDCCAMCSHVKYLKRNEEYRRTGKNTKPRVERRG